MVDRKAPGPYIAALSGIVGGTALQHLFGWDNGTMMAGAGITLAAIVGIAMVRNKIRTGRWTMAPKSAAQADK
jgi:hypothetical protein